MSEEQPKGPRTTAAVQRYGEVRSRLKESIRIVERLQQELEAARKELQRALEEET